LAAGHEDLEWLSFNSFVEDPDAFGRKLGGQLEEEFESLRYNRQTLEAIDQYAPDYDVEELSPLGTRAVIFWENERVLTAFRETKKRLNRPLRILDVGCGTGRFEELLLSHTDTRGHIEEIVAVDFVPQFLRKAQDRLAELGLESKVEEKVVFKRRIAEDLQLPSESFDMVLASFGLPSFSDHQRAIPEGARVLQSGGTMVLTVYNDNSLNFEYEEKFSERATGHRRSFFSVDIDRDENTMTLPGGDPFHCYTFTPEYLIEVVGQNLFVPTEEARGQAIDYAPMETFPVIHGCTQRRFIERLTSGANEDGKPIEEPVSYMQGAIEGTSGYSRDLYRMDRELCRLSALRDRGLYINVIASKS
jgi:ubiquinone/menaquinone biosynthesis C-methylase UbiE